MWDEIDTGKKMGPIPASKMKAKAEHRVPLSDATLRVLKHAQTLRDKSGLVFPPPTRSGQPMSDMTLTKILRDNDLAEKTVVHGFRSCFRT